MNSHSPAPMNSSRLMSPARTASEKRQTSVPEPMSRRQMYTEVSAGDKPRSFQLKMLPLTKPATCSCDSDGAFAGASLGDA